MATVSMRNRTAEFQSIVDNVRASGKSQQSSASKRERTRTQFSMTAAAIGKDIHNTSIKLKKLTDLAQRRTLFDDPTAEIQELTSVVKQDIATLHGKFENLSQLREANPANKQVKDHTNNVVNSLKTKLMSTTHDFQEVLKTRTDSLQAQQDRRSQFLSAGQEERRFSQPMSDQVSPNPRRLSHPAAGAGDSVAIDLGSGSAGAEAAGASPRQRSSAFSQSMMAARPEQGYQQARADAVRQVESTIVELGQIFNQLATMVAEQGEMVERIDANVEDTAMNVNAGQLQLMRYYNSLSTNRSLILKIFATVLVFLFIWVIIA